MTRLLLPILLAASLAQAALPAPVPIHPDALDPLVMSTDQAVALLAGLLADKDPLVRERAARDLGLTGNPASLDHLRHALSDPHPRVRAAAVIASADLLPQAAPLVIAALADADPLVLLTALSAVRRAPLPQAAATAQSLASHANPAVRAAALDALKALASPLGAAKVTPLLADADPAVRLAALASLLAAPAGATFDGLAPLKALAAGPSPAQAGLAVEALGRFDWPGSESIVAQAAADNRTLLRRGACNAYARAGQGAKVAAMLDDPSPLVRLAAIRGVGGLKVAGCQGKLFALMTAPRNDGRFAYRGEYNESILRPAPAAEDPHEAALQALERLPGPETAALALRFLTENAAPLADREHEFEALRLARKALPPESQDRLEQLRRNMAAACRLLGSCGGKEAVEPLCALLDGLAATRDGVTAINAETVCDAAEALGRLDDARAIEPLRRAFAVVTKRTGPYLAELNKLDRGPITFGHHGAAALIAAMARLKAPSAFDETFAMLNLSPSGRGLTLEYVEALERWPALADAAGKVRLRGVVERLLKPAPPDRADLRSIRRRYAAARAAVAMGMTEAAPLLRTDLAAMQEDRTYAGCAAWAIEQLTGKSEPLPAALRATGDWIVRPAVGQE